MHERGGITVNMDRRKFLKIASIAAGAVVAGGGAIYVINRESTPP